VNPRVEPEYLLTFAEAARRLAVSLRQFRRLVDSGKIPVARVSERAPRIRASDLGAYVNGVMVGSKS
jgi:excisionase family DNA binding protein